ncbi:ATP-dependent DNA helicase PIF1 isoform X2 [Venturia canescens]|uniref:ATP-dependent DNA helicase PIF1 isoform X2 n=1 Tax=Venturia canescens TaxID=32260 RepID=UPI001C9CC58A|nr:ATP-dependent DNA helicase PIF1 isoform X2 [Venturia canescens]
MALSLENSTLTCSVVLEWLDGNGSISRKATYRTAILRLLRNDLRQIVLEVCVEKAKVATKLRLKGISVFNRYMNEGKATIKFPDDKCTIFLSNAPTVQLVSFLKMIFVKMTGQTKDMQGENVLHNKLLSDKRGGLSITENISPATNAELAIAREKALKKSRATTTSPSPNSVRKRKLNITPAKRLYSNAFTGTMSEEQKRILDTVLKGLPPDVTVTTASTGVAACHIGGVTLHQFAGIGLGSATLDRCYELASKPAVASVWRKTKHLVIDEISMVDGDFFDKMEAVARHIRKNDKPFGGIQLILCGDFFQLPPVSKSEKKTKFCFQSMAWKECIKYNFELNTVYRQEDPKFVDLLNRIRVGYVTEEIACTLRATSSQKIEKNGILATRLCSHICEADEINSSQLDKLAGEEKIFIAQDSDENMTKILEQQLPVPHKLTLKVGAQVMLLKNININSGLVNGARGIIVKFVGDTPVVQFRSGKEYHATLEKWTIKRMGNSFVHRKQIPLKLAWAFSIHKSQGLTLDCVEMSLGRVFDAGQAYVALSRAQSLDSLRVLDFNTEQIWADRNVLEFYKRFRRNLQEIKLIPLGKKFKLTAQNNPTTTPNRK